MSNITEMQFSHMIAETLASNPEWHRAALDGLSAGMAKAIELANTRADQSNFAMLSALTLADAKRVTPELKAVLTSKIIEAFAPEDNRCELERRFANQEQPQ